MLESFGVQKFAFSAAIAITETAVSDPLAKGRCAQLLGVHHSPGISSLGERLTKVRTGKLDRARSPICRQCVAFMECPFVELEDVRSVLSVSQGCQCVPIGQPAIEVDLAVIPVELPKVLGDSCSLPFQMPQAGRCRLKLWYRRRVVGHSPTLKLARCKAALVLEQSTAFSPYASGSGESSPPARAKVWGRARISCAGLRHGLSPATAIDCLPNH